MHIKFHLYINIWYIDISLDLYICIYEMYLHIYFLLEDAGAAKGAGCQAYLIGWQFSQIRLVGKNATRGLALVKAAVATWESHPVQPYGWTKSSTNGVQNLWIVPLPRTNRLRRNLSLSCFHVVLSLRSSCTVWSFCRQAECQWYQSERSAVHEEVGSTWRSGVQRWPPQVWWILEGCDWSFLNLPLLP